MNFDVLPLAKAMADKAILQTGLVRSGTSILAKLVYSLEGVELFYEPIFLTTFLQVMDGRSESDIENFVSSYVFRELLMDALAGRRINLNRHDESSIHHSKSSEEIEARLAQSHRMRSLLSVVESHRIALKITDMAPNFDRLRGIFPQMTFIATIRKPESVIVSLLERGWCSDEQLRETASDIAFHPGTHAGMRIPLWVPAHRLEEFVAATEKDRCAIYIEHQLRHIVERTDCLIFDYDHFVADPARLFGALAERLGHRFGAMTAGLIASIREPVRNRTISADSIDQAKLSVITDLYRQGVGRAVGMGA